MDFRKFKAQFEKEVVKEHPTQVNTEPLVSICVQTYNQSSYISQCLDSLLMQKTAFPFEILIGEDNSTDGTREICLEYATQNPDKIRLFLHHRENNIQVNGRSTGLFNSFYNLFSAKGRYIAYCDGDDYWTDSQKLQKQVDFLEKNQEYVITYHSAKIVNQYDEEIKKNIFPNIYIKQDFTSLELMKAVDQPIISTWCFKNVVRQIPLEMTQTLNADNFWMSLLGFYGKGKYLDDIKPSHYRIHEVGIWSLINKEAQLLSKMNTYQKLSSYHARNRQDELTDYFRKRSLNYSKMLIYHYWKTKKPFKAIRSVLAHYKLFMR